MPLNYNNIFKNIHTKYLTAILMSPMAFERGGGAGLWQKQGCTACSRLAQGSAVPCGLGWCHPAWHFFHHRQNAEQQHNKCKRIVLALTLSLSLSLPLFHTLFCFHLFIIHPPLSILTCTLLALSLTHPFF